MVACFTSMFRGRGGKKKRNFKKRQRAPRKPAPWGPTLALGSCRRICRCGRALAIDFSVTFSEASRLTVGQRYVLRHAVVSPEVSLQLRDFKAIIQQHDPDDLGPLVSFIVRHFGQGHKFQWDAASILTFLEHCLVAICCFQRQYLNHFAYQHSFLHVAKYQAC